MEKPHSLLCVRERYEIRARVPSNCGFFCGLESIDPMNYLEEIILMVGNRLQHVRRKRPISGTIPELVSFGPYAYLFSPEESQKLIN